MKFKIILSKSGERIYKGGNIEVLNKALIDFEAKNKNEAENKAYHHIMTTLGSASYYNFDLKEIV